MAEGPIKVYKDRVEISTLSASDVSTTNLTINGTVTGISASTIGAATTSQLNSLSTTINNLSTTVNSNYSTLDNKFSNYLPLSGGELTGNLTIKGTTNNTWIRASNDYSAIYLEAASSGTRGIWDSGKNAWIVSVDSNKNVNLDGNATTANKLNTDAGSTTKPVYFSGGIPKECDTNLAVSITGSSTSCTGNAASASELQTAGTAHVNLASTNNPTYTNGGNIALGVSGVLPAVNGGTGVDSLYIEGSITPISGTLTETSYVRQYSFLKLVVFSIKLEQASFSKGSAIIVASLSGVEGAPTNCGVSAYCSGSSTNQVISRAYMGGTNIYIYFNTDVSSRSIGISGAYLY